MPVRIEYFIDHLNVGGAQRHLVALFGHLDRARWAPQVCIGKPGGALVPVIERMGIPVHSFGVGASLARPGTLGAFVRTARRLRAEGVQIVHGYLYLGNVMGMLAGRLARTPVRIASKRSLDRYPRRPQLAVTRLANRCADHIVCNAEAVRTFVLTEERPDPTRVSVIPNGIRLDTPPPPSERPPGIPAHARVVGTIGRLSWKKAYPDFVEAARRVRLVRSDVEFVVIGDGPLRGEIEACATRLGVREHVHFLGELHQVRGLLRGFDAFVISSVIEGMPNVVLEALLAERPVVATRVGGIPEIVTDGETGLLVAPGDPAGLADRILRVLDDQSLAARLGAQGRRTVEMRFGVRAMVEQVEGLYERLCAGNGVRAAAPPAAVAAGATVHG